MIPKEYTGDHELPHDSCRDRLIGLSRVTFIPRDVWANARAQGSDELDHERDMTLAIHAAIPDLIRDTNRHVSSCLMALARRLEWN
jgi:hypothetical protein